MKTLERSTLYIMMITMLALVVPVFLFAQINWTEHTIDSTFDGATCVYAVDVEPDSDIDVLGAAANANEIAWWKNDGNENFTKHTIDSTFDGASSVYAIDLDNDNDIDVLGTANLLNTIAWWKNDGNENFTKHTIDSAFDGASSVYAIDMDNDSDIDILGAAVNANEIAWWKNDGNENFTKHTIDANFDGTSVYAIDMDNDSDIDVLGAARFANEIAWWENDGNENFTRHTIDSTFTRAFSVYAIDMDNDSDIDILGAARIADEIAWWENDGNENFTKHTIDDNFDGARSVYAIDLENDNDIDVLGAANLLNTITWWENDGNENFTEHTITSDFNRASSVYALDLDGNNNIDVLGAARFANEITWWENDLIVDVGPVSIDIPDTLPQDTTLYPQATVTNFGTPNNETFIVTCTIDPGDYNRSRTVNNLAPGDSIQVTFFLEFTFESGSYTVTVYTQLVGDMNPLNDTLEKVIETYDPGIAEGNPGIPETFVFNAPTITKNRTDIRLALPKATKVDLLIYDASGRLSKTLISKRFSSGFHNLHIDLDLPSGVYFYNLKTDSGKKIIQKFLLVE